jgi:hypothetical protein
MKRWTVLSILLASQLASADPQHVLVLRAEGTADKGARRAIDTHVLDLAKHVPGNVEAGDISFADASAAVGCTPGDSSCSDDVLSTLGVDEVVTTTATTGPGGEVTVTVKRIGKGGAVHEATSTIPAGQSAGAKLDADLGPLFGVTAPPPPKTAPPPVEHAPPATPPTATPAVEHAPPAEPPPDHPAAPVRTAQASPPSTVTAAPAGQVAETPPEAGGHRRLETAGMAVGGGLVLIGVILWAEASSTQNDINNAPTRSPMDFQNLQQLESRGDSESALGNATFAIGLGLAAVSTFFYIRDRRSGHADHVARVAPAVFDHGAGLTLTVGGAP